MCQLFHLRLRCVPIVCLCDCSVLPSALPIHHDFFGQEPPGLILICNCYRIHWVEDYWGDHRYRPAVACILVGCCSHRACDD